MTWTLTEKLEKKKRKRGQKPKKVSLTTSGKLPVTGEDKKSQIFEHDMGERKI